MDVPGDILAVIFAAGRIVMEGHHVQESGGVAVGERGLVELLPDGHRPGCALRHRRAYDERPGSVAADDARRLRKVIDVPGIGTEVSVPTHSVGRLPAQVRLVPDLVGRDAAREAQGNLIDVGLPELDGAGSRAVAPATAPGGSATQDQQDLLAVSLRVVDDSIELGEFPLIPHSPGRIEVAPVEGDTQPTDMRIP